MNRTHILLIDCRASARCLQAAKLVAGIAAALAFSVACASPPNGPDGSTALRVVSRNSWHAIPPNPGKMNDADGWRIYPNPSNSLNTITIHHTGEDKAASPRGIQRRHIQRGFADIGYHFLIDGRGVVYEGRDLNVEGAHTAGYNAGAIGVALIGDFNAHEPSAAQLAGLRLLIRQLKSRFAALGHLAGHHDFSPEGTACPGTKLEALLPALARETGLVWGAANPVGKEGA